MPPTFWTYGVNDLLEDEAIERAAKAGVLARACVDVIVHADRGGSAQTPSRHGLPAVDGGNPGVGRQGLVRGSFHPHPTLALTARPSSPFPLMFGFACVRPVAERKREQNRTEENRSLQSQSWTFCREVSQHGQGPANLCTATLPVKLPIACRERGSLMAGPKSGQPALTMSAGQVGNDSGVSSIGRTGIGCSGSLALQWRGLGSTLVEEGGVTALVLRECCAGIALVLHWCDIGSA